MERKIGNVFKFEGKWLKVQEGESLGSCEHCYFENEDCARFRSFIGVCTHKERSDKKGVIFEDITYEPEEQPKEQPQEEQQETEEIKERKIGETFEYQGHKLKVMESEDGCTGCYLEDCLCRNNRIIGECISYLRNDKKGVIFVDITDEPEEQQPQEEQPQELNLCEVLKYCPQGETFWSPMLGDVKLNDIDQETKKINVILASGATWDINADGTITIDNVTSPEVMLYPSCEQMVWTKVKYEKKKELPRTWEEFCIMHDIKTNEYFIGETGKIFNSNSGKRIPDISKTLLPSKQAAEAHLAYKQLHQLRDAWREGWLPDWTDEDQTKYVILNTAGEFTIRGFYTMSCFLAFQDEKRAKDFFACFIDLIRKAGDLI